MVLAEAIDTDGVDSAVALYAELRENYHGLGVYNFGEWEMNELARMQSASGEKAGAIAMLLVNEEFYPDSPSIQFSLGQLYEETGDTESAIARYERTLELVPEHRGAVARLEELRGG